MRIGGRKYAIPGNDSGERRGVEDRRLVSKDGLRSPKLVKVHPSHRKVFSLLNIAEKNSRCCFLSPFCNKKAIVKSRVDGETAQNCQSSNFVRMPYIAPPDSELRGAVSNAALFFPFRRKIEGFAQAICSSKPAVFKGACTTLSPVHSHRPPLHEKECQHPSAVRFHSVYSQYCRIARTDNSYKQRLHTSIKVENNVVHLKWTLSVTTILVPGQIMLTCCSIGTYSGNVWKKSRLRGL